MAVTSGVKSSYDITAAATSAGVGTAPDRRRLYDFSDRVAELAPEESPFFVYLSKVAKVPTDDPVFRFLENRSKIDWTTRSFKTAAAVNGGSAVSAGSSYTFTVDADAATGGTSSGGASVDFLVKGMVFAVNTVSGASGYSQTLVRVDSSPQDQGTSTTFQGKIIDISNTTTAGDSAITGEDIIADNDNCQVIGTSFGEGTGSPDAWSNEIEDDFGYTQIFKTAAEMSNTAIATRYRGYANEWERIWALKLREHKVDIERAMLFGQRARVSSVQYTEGIVGHILKNGQATLDDSAFSYSSGSPYFRSVASAELTYDRLLSDLEVIFDPARGGASEKLVLAGLPVVSFFNKLGSTSFLSQSMAYNANAALSGGATTTNQSPHRMNMSERAGAFGHKVMTIETIHGTMHLVKEPLFRGISANMMAMVDMSKVSYRPLVGNGLNRDTAILTNVQNADEDLRKDMILTEAGLEISLPEAHALYQVEL
tara:strand:+ start:5018 stop:6466 length:1449 start_codon:yes stop_codon:yes gene_type:complete